jgi:hypothetical protein
MTTHVRSYVIYFFNVYRFIIYLFVFLLLLIHVLLMFNPFMPRLVDSPILLNWINLFPKLGMSSIFISILRLFLTEIPLGKQRRPR